MAEPGRLGRNREREGRFGVRILDPGIQQSFAMKSASRHDQFIGSAAAPGESKFEKPETGPFFEPAVCAHFGRKLQKIFPLPPDSSAPEEVRILLRKIQARFSNFPAP